MLHAKGSSILTVLTMLWWGYAALRLICSIAKEQAMPGCPLWLSRYCTVYPHYGSYSLIHCSRYSHHSMLPQGPIAITSHYSMLRSGYAQYGSYANRSSTGMLRTGHNRLIRLYWWIQAVQAHVARTVILMSTWWIQANAGHPKGYEASPCYEYDDIDGYRFIIAYLPILMNMMNITDLGWNWALSS